MLVNQSKLGPYQGQKRLSLPWAWHSTAQAFFNMRRTASLTDQNPDVSITKLYEAVVRTRARFMSMDEY